ncbi:hypothetical protein CH352_18805 [Leptospira hartskeerlii]|uniref:Uncharacterized protein n=1 Tax=Leptospira hartskeerlii TaxID=2023177 RepID=A0A2M9X8A4_9LEPT|nr:hypothetical protein [Leptospira hartskeerlii]PJZ23926.1 hypothetical protein CH357_18715 [Leptospira hartskeerlii]PJZ31934.1 hypothetical protein CH352_18805 [Leptospira hartskeerlii]
MPKFSDYISVMHLRGFFLWQSIKNGTQSFIFSSVFFDTANFLLSTIIGGFLFAAKDFEFVKGYFVKPEFFTIYFSILLLIIASIVFYFKRRMTARKNDAFKKINEVMNESFYIIIDYFGERMNLIHEASSKQKVKVYLSEITEPKLFENLAKCLHSFFNNLFSDNPPETKIDIYKANNNALEPLLFPMINGIFINGRKSHSFRIISPTKTYASLAEYSFSRNLVGFLTNVDKVQSILDGISNESKKEYYRERFRLYYERHDGSEAFELGTIMTFPLKKGTSRYGVLTIGFKEISLDHHLNSIGISEEDFRNNISTFVDKYTEFVTTMSAGILKIRDHIKS